MIRVGSEPSGQTDPKAPFRLRSWPLVLCHARNPNRHDAAPEAG